MHDGIDGQACLGVDLQLGGEVASVGGNRMHREAQLVGYLLAGHTLGNTTHNLLLALAQLVGRGAILQPFALGVAPLATRPNPALQSLNGGDKEPILHRAVLGQVVLAVDDVEQHRVEQIPIVALGVVAHNYVLQVGQLLVQVVVFGGEGGNVVLLVQKALLQPLDIGKDGRVFILHVGPHLGHILVVKFQNQQRHLIFARAIYGLDEFAANIGHIEVQKPSVGPFQILHQRS